MSGWVKTNSPMLGSRVNPWVPEPIETTIIVAELYRMYPEAWARIAWKDVSLGEMGNRHRYPADYDRDQDILIVLG
jgi:hypothetical protein